MIKGLLALFRSGVIFDPFVLMGILLGLITALSGNEEAMKQLYNGNSLYLLVLLLSILYNYFIKKEYKDDGERVDYVKMIFNIILSLVKFVVSCAFAIVFVLMLFSF